MWSTFFESLKLTKIFSKISVNFEGEKNSRPQFGNPETSSFSVLNFYIPDTKTKKTRHLIPMFIGTPCRCTYICIQPVPSFACVTKFSSEERSTYSTQNFNKTEQRYFVGPNRPRDFMTKIQTNKKTSIDITTILICRGATRTFARGWGQYIIL